MEGHPPFEREHVLATLTAVVTDDPEPATHAGPLWPVIDGLLRKNPDERLAAAETDQLLRRVAASAAARHPPASDSAPTAAFPADSATEPTPAEPDAPAPEAAPAESVAAEPSACSPGLQSEPAPGSRLPLPGLSALAVRGPRCSARPRWP